MLRSAASPGSRGVRPARERCEWPPHTTASGRPPFWLDVHPRVPALRERRRAKTKGAATAPSITAPRWVRLLDLAFAELDVLLRDRIVLLLDQLLGLRARVLLGDVIVAGVRARHELHLDGGRLGHAKSSGLAAAGR